MTDVLDRLGGVGDDERVVLSVIADRDGDGWRLLHATVLVVPARCDELGWRAWMDEQADRVLPYASPRVTGSVLASDGDGWLLARETLTPQAAGKWLADIVDAAERGVPFEAPGIGVVPSVTADLAPADAIVRVFPRVSTSVSNLVCAAGRPVDGLVWRARSPVRETTLALPEHVQAADGTYLSWASVDVCGIHLTPASVAETSRTREGLLVGRLERRAWIAGLRGSKEADRVKVTLGHDSALVGLDELDVLHNEYDQDEILVASNRVRLADLDLSQVRTPLVTVTMPAHGSKLRHEVVLSDREGQLVDRCGPYPFAEVVETAIKIGDGDPVTVTTGTTLVPSTLDDRLQLAEQARASLDETARQGADRRMLRGEEGRQRLRALARRARGELLIADRYFGQEEEDWELVDGLAVPVRVLTSKLAGEPAPVPTGVAAKVRPKARDMHDRVYLWDNGGMVLGGSPSTLRTAPIWMASLTPAEAAVHRERFERRWSSPLFRDVSRRPDSA